MAEIGVEMSRFPTSAHLASWAKVSPGTQRECRQTQERVHRSVLLPRPSNLGITIDRTTGDITKDLFAISVYPEGALYGVYSLFDLPGKWLELKLGDEIQVVDAPEIVFMSYQNDTFLTTGKFVENVIMEPPRFQGPFPAPSTGYGQASGVAFLYHLSDRDLGASAQFEASRR